MSLKASQEESLSANQLIGTKIIKTMLGTFWVKFQKKGLRSRNKRKNKQLQSFRAIGPKHFSQNCQNGPFTPEVDPTALKWQLLPQKTSYLKIYLGFEEFPLKRDRL